MKKVILILLGTIILLMDFFLILGIIMFINIGYGMNVLSYTDFIIPIIMLCIAILCFVMAGYTNKGKNINIQNSKVKIDNQRPFVEPEAVISYKKINLRKSENDNLKKAQILEAREVIEEPLQQEEVIEKSNLQEIRKVTEVIEEPTSQESTETIKELYSQEIKELMEKIKNSGLKEILTEKIKKGVSLSQIAKEISEETEQDFETVYNLAEFESALVHENANFRAYEAAGIEQYQFWSEHELTVCPICASLDMKVFDVKDRKIGVNAPPMHLGCHCITVEYDPFEKEDYINSGLEPPEERETWQQWYDNQTKK